MANDLLTSFRTVSQAHRHIVFNERTQEFERAGKRHAIASFFGSADARAKNDITLQKIKEALNAEVSDSGQFKGYGKVSDGIFSGVDSTRRIKSSTINAIIRSFRENAASAPDRLSDMKDATVKTILDSVSLPLKSTDRTGCAHTIFAMMTRQLLDSELSGSSVSMALDELNQFTDCQENLDVAGSVKSGLTNFLGAINCSQEAQKSFSDILDLVEERGSDRFNQMAGCELARIAAAFNANPGFDVQEALGRLCARMDELSPAQNALLEMEAIPITADSYDLALDFGGWMAENRTDCLNLLSRQPMESRIPLLAAMKAFGESRDVHLLHKLVGVQDAIKILHDYGNLNPENICRAIEGELVALPECIANEAMTMRGEELLASFYGRGAAAEIEAAVSKNGWSQEKVTAAQTEGLRLMGNYGISADDVMECIKEVDTKYPVFTGDRYWAVVGLRVALGDSFENMSSGVKYNLLSVPDGYRRPLIEAFKLVTGGNSYDDRLLHLLIAKKDEIVNLWETGRLTKENAMRTVVAGRAGMQEPAAHINPYYQAFCPEFGCGLDKAVERLAESLKNENEFMIVLDSPRFDRLTFCSREGRDTPGRIEESEKHSHDIGSILEMFCGEKNQEQVAMALSGMALAAKQVLLPHFISNGAENRSLVFNPLYAVSIEESGDIELKISSLPGSGISLDWTVTIHPDGTQSTTGPVVGVQDS